MNNSNTHANTAPVKKIRGLKRKLIQIAAFGFTNAHIPNFLSGKLYTGKWKEFCAPGLNCYSCPAAAFACPIGALQAVTGSRKSPISFYVFGLLLAFGVIFGRAVCGFLCPFGLLQEGAAAKAELADKRINIEQSGSIAEASLKLTRIFEEAQKAADLYLENVKKGAHLNE